MGIYKRSYLNHFTSRDSHPGNSRSPSTAVHAYSYVSNSPVNRTDPSGLCEQYLPDEACWSVYETIKHEFPHALVGLYFHRFEYVPLDRLPEGRLRNELRLLRLSQPNAYASVVYLEAARFGLPTEILYGVLEAEILLDTNAGDVLGDLFTELFPSFSADYLDTGPGVGNIHLATARNTLEHYLENYTSCPTTQSLGIGGQGEDNALLASQLLESDYNIRFMAAIVRHLADYRFGSDRKPLTTDHADVGKWTLQDAVAVWHGYRYGVPDVSPKPAYGFEDLDDFQNRTFGINELIFEVITGEDAHNSARFSVPIFRRLGLSER